MRVAAILVALPLLLAGCLGEEPAATSEPDAPASEETLAAVAEDGTPIHVARFASAVAVDETRWANGTFAPDQAASVHDLVPAPPLVAGERSFVRVDISDLVPVGVPTRIFATLESTMAQGDLDLWLMVPDGEWRTANFNAPYGGSTSFEIGIVHAAPGPVEVVLFYDVLDPGTEHPYVLSVRVVSEPDLLLNGVATGVPLPAAARFDVALIGEKRERGPEIEDAALVVYGPDDDVVGRFPLAAGTTSITLPEDSPEGEYVLLLSQGGRNARLHVHGAPAELRALDVEWIGSDPVEFDAQGRASWSWELDRAPLLAGIIFTSPNVARGVEFTLAGPGGPLLAERWEWTQPWLSFEVAGVVGMGNSVGIDSFFGAPGLDAGTYTAEVAYDVGAGGQPARGMTFAAVYVR